MADEETTNGYDRCRRGYFCLFEHKDGKGEHREFEYKRGCRELKRFDNKASSYRNRTGKDWCLYKDHDCEGNHYCVEGHDHEGHNLPSDWNNRVSSLRGCTCSED